MKTKIQLITLLATVAFMWGFTPVISARKTGKVLKGCESDGFNALEHVLQKPLGNPEFPEEEKPFVRNIFTGVNGGGSWINSLSGQSLVPGYNAGVHVGSWLSPVNGLQFTITSGKHSVLDEVPDAYYASIKGDYLVNLTSLMRGYSPYHRFELIGSMGAVYQRTRQSGTYGNNYGGATSLMFKYNAGKHSYFFAQPELTLLAGMRYNTVSPRFRFMTNLSFNVGVGSRLYVGERRQREAVRFEQDNEDNFYFGAGGGVFDCFPHSSGSLSPMGSAYVGKVLTAFSSVQLSGRMGRGKDASNIRDRYLGIGSLDYVLNLSHLITGYHDRNPLQLSANAGGSLGVVYRNKSIFAAGESNSYKYFTGVQAGLSAQYNVSDNFGIYFHPQIYLFANGYKTAMNAQDRSMVSVDLGVRYTVGHYTRDNRDGALGGNSAEFEDSDKHWFAQATFGKGSHGQELGWLTNNYVVSVGRRFTEISSLRVNAEGIFFPLYKRGTIGADYMADMITPITGYDPERRFDLQATMGGLIGVSDFENTKLATGVKGGLSASLRLFDNLSLVVEPEVLILRDAVNAVDARKWTPEARISVGLKYSFGFDADK